MPKMWSKTCLIKLSLIMVTVLFCQGFIFPGKNGQSVGAKLVPLKNVMDDNNPNDFNTFDSSKSSNDDPSIEPDVNYSNWNERFDEVMKDMKAKADKLKDEDYRKQVKEHVRSNIFTIAKSVVQNLSEGEFGKRGEGWFLGQLILVYFLLFGVHPLVAFALHFAAVGSFVLGLYIIFRAVFDLGRNTTPFPAPINANELITDGIYDVVLHPMYGGLILFALGLALLSGSVDKMAVAVCLAVLLDRKADEEELMLMKKHPDSYVSYAASRKKFLPFLF